MAEMENLAIVRKAFEALGKNQLDQFKSLLAPNVEWRAPGPKHILPFAGLHKGPEAVVEWWKKLGKSEEALRFEPRMFIPHEDTVVVVGDSEMRVKSTNKTLQAEWVQIYRVKDGKIVDFREFYDTAQEVAAYRAA